MSFFVFALGLGLHGGMVSAAADGDREILKAVAPSVVQIEYTLRYDGADSPVSRGWNQRCPNCGNFHSDSVDSLVREKRPLERAGFLISPTQVVTAHALIHPRFIEGISVSYGGETVEARAVAYAVEQRGVVLELAEPLAGAKPLVFNGDADDSLYFVTPQEADGTWRIGIQPFSGALILDQDGGVALAATPESVIVDSAGRAVAVTMNESLAYDGGWVGSPMDWQMISIGQMETLLSRHAEQVARFMPRVSLNFRSPRETPEDRYRHRRDSEVVTEQDVLGLVLAEGYLLVLSGLDPATTARLERIRVHLPDYPTPVAAEFVASLADYGAFVARMDDAPDAVEFSDGPLGRMPGQLILSTELEVVGEQTQVHHEPARIAGLRRGYQRALFPDLAGQDSNLHLFDLEGALVALPIELRDRSEGQHRRWRSSRKVLTPAGVVATVLDDLDNNLDAANVPLDASEEGRLAWVGVELQPLDPALARDLRVATETSDGDTGALVTYVYAGSPAAEVGIEAGDVLLRIVAPGLPRPVSVRLEQDHRGGQPFPWDQLDQVPDQYFSYLPLPWTSAANEFTRFLTGLGFGTEAVVEGSRDGQPIRFELAVVRGPVHYEAAAQHRSDPLGLTLRDLSYETRRFFQKAEDAPGLIIARIEAGSPASTAGLKPYEIITHVNGEPLLSAADFEALDPAEAEYSFSVQRMNQGRIVLITNPGSGE